MGVYSDRQKKRGLRHGSGQKRGVLGTGQARKKGDLRHGSGQKGGSLLRHIPVLDIYVSAPPPGPIAVCLDMPVVDSETKYNPHSDCMCQVGANNQRTILTS